MKKKLQFLLVLSLGMNSLFAQENYSKYYPMEEGVAFRYTMYNKKEKAEGVTDYIISEVSYDSSNTSATFDLKFTDNKGWKYTIPILKSAVQITASK
jgi:hypothetical protein